MQKLGLNELREKYLNFFESKGHLRMRSFPLVPLNDKSLLLINSGMAPLKPYFTGLETPPNKRVVTCQKCIRTGDIENVGKTSRHGTFFEMIGNFSFGDYFKQQAIEWSWEFVIKDLEMPYEKLYVSVYYEDEEAYNIWNKKIGLPKEKIFKMGKDDNFWEVGIGPCGPCSELYYDRGSKYGCNKPNCTVGCDCDRYIEFWNLVFTQFNKKEDGTYEELEQKNIDTGMGLERIGTIMQDVNSIFDVDTIKVIRDKICELTGVEYGKDLKKDESVRVITDHIRSVTFMAADGILPSNESRGYVLRRLLRRSVRHGKLLGIKNNFLSDICEVVIKVSKEAYPELLEKQEYILKVISVEEKHFIETLEQGLDILRQHIDNMKNNSIKVLAGTDAFKLYDTFGFPMELMQEILEEENLKIDLNSFNTEMEKQKQRARNARETSNFMGSDAEIYNSLDPEIISEFKGYKDKTLKNNKILALISNNKIVDEVYAKDEVQIILDKTSFYAESGGQNGDKGLIITDKCTVQVSNCIKVIGNRIVHQGLVLKGILKSGDTVTTKVDKNHRLSSCRNHTATHLLQKALRDYLGNHIEQAGSLVNADRLRFDFTHFSALTQSDLSEIESMVNQKILQCIDVSVSEENIQDAKKMGAMALFGEKYSDKVRVVNIGNYSLELCGGTHVCNTSQICSFKIVSESSVASGVRRIEALTGQAVFEYYNKLNNKLCELCEIIKTTPDNLIKKVEGIVLQNKKLSSEIEKIKSNITNNFISEILNKKQEIGNITVIATQVEECDINSLKTLGDKLKDKINLGVIIIANTFENKLNLLVMATDKAVKKGINCSDIAKSSIIIADGKGGGKPNIAQAGGKDISKINDVLSKAKDILKLQLE